MYICEYYIILHEINYIKSEVSNIVLPLIHFITMGIFSLNSSKTITTKDFYFGAPEAEGENVRGQSLTDYFEDFLYILDELKKGKFIFVGRKGVGKSAIAKFIKDKSDKSEDSFATVLRISDLSTESNIQIQNKTDDLSIELFEWLILVNIVKLVVKSDCGKYTKEFEKLRKFLERNTGSVEIDKFQIDENFIKSGGEINFSVLSHAFGGVIGKYFKTKETKAPFYKLIKPLKEILSVILKYPEIKYEFWLLFDDLDINYEITNESDNKKIIELLRIAKHYNNEVFKDINAKILIFIRDDVRDFIISKYSDSAKIFNSYEIFINWYNHYDEHNNPLKLMANKRIEINFNKLNLKCDNDDAWNCLFINEYSEYPTKNSFKYVLDFTFYRPRDLITFLRMVSEDVYHYPINHSDLKKIINKYISTNIAEIKSELSLFFNENEKNRIFDILFRYISQNSGLNVDTVLKKIKEIGFNNNEEVLNLLIKYSLLIYQNPQRELFFNYRETQIDNMDKKNFTLFLPKCIYHYYKPLK